MQYGNIERVTHNEITHVLDLARSEQWPFEKINQNKNWVQVTQEPLGFSRNYGTKNREEDIATT